MEDHQLIQMRLEAHDLFGHARSSSSDQSPPRKVTVEFDDDGFPAQLESVNESTATRFLIQTRMEARGLFGFTLPGLEHGASLKRSERVRKVLRSPRFKKYVVPVCEAPFAQFP